MDDKRKHQLAWLLHLDATWKHGADVIRGAYLVRDISFAANELVEAREKLAKAEASLEKVAEEAVKRLKQNFGRDVTSVQEVKDYIHALIKDAPEVQVEAG
jgi:DNA mismatch repair ATPase MutS